MKYDPKKLTYGDALKISTANMTVTVEDENGQHVTGKLKHIGPNDALAGDNLALRDLILLALITTSNEYFMVCDDDERILCLAIRFDHDLNVTWNTIISIEENPDDGVELDFADWKATLVKAETPTADEDKPTDDTQTEEWEKQLPKANGFYKAATGSVWLHTGDIWTPILDHHGNVPPARLAADHRGIRRQQRPFETIPVRTPQREETADPSGLLPQQGQDEPIPPQQLRRVEAHRLHGTGLQLTDEGPMGFTTRTGVWWRGRVRETRPKRHASPLLHPRSQTAEGSGLRGELLNITRRAGCTCAYCVRHDPVKTGLIPYCRKCGKSTCAAARSHMIMCNVEAANRHKTADRLKNMKAEDQQGWVGLETHPRHDKENIK